MFISRQLSMQPNTVSPMIMFLTTIGYWYCCCTKHFAVETKQCVPCIVRPIYVYTYAYVSVFLPQADSSDFYESSVGARHIQIHEVCCIFFFFGESSITPVQKFYINLPMASRPLPNDCNYTAASSTEECCLHCHKRPVGDAGRSNLADIFRHLVARLLHKKIICHYHCNGGSCRY